MPGLRVHGTPMPKGSLTCYGPRACRKCGTAVVHAITEDDKTGQGKVWRKLLEQAGDALRRSNGFTYEGPVQVRATFVLDRPASARKRLWPHTRPDVDKLARMVLDALTSAHVIHDDALVVDLHASKCYPCHLCGLDTAGVVLWIDTMPHPDAPTLIES